MLRGAGDRHSDSPGWITRRSDDWKRRDLTDQPLPGWLPPMTRYRSNDVSAMEPVH